MIKRIELIMQAQNLTSSQFADRIGVQRSGLSHILSGRNNPSLDFVLKVLASFPEINPLWLLHGKGKMYADLAEVPVSSPVPDHASPVDLFTAHTGREAFVAAGSENPESGRSAETSIPDTAGPGIPKKDREKNETDCRTERSDSGTDAGLEDGEKDLPLKSGISERKVPVRIVFFYADGTFREFRPENGEPVWKVR